MANPYIIEEKALLAETQKKKKDEQEKVLDWRGEFFSNIFPQFDEEEISRLVFSTASPHDALKLKDKSCPDNLILEILS